MTYKLVLIIGGALILIGFLGFLAAGVALYNADKVAEIKSPKGTQIMIPDDAPIVLERKKQAEFVLFGTLLIGGIGLCMVVSGIYKGKRNSFYSPK